MDKYFTAFIPFRLEVENRPELKFFPLNIMFDKWKVENDKWLNGYSIYEPDLSTLNGKDKILSMTYRNKYGGNNYVVISISEEDNSFRYKGEKYVNGERVGMGSAVISSFNDENGWRMFFTHLTLLRLSTGEQFRYWNIIDELSPAG